MYKKIITTIPATSDSGMLCCDCPLKGQGMNQKQFCSFYKKGHDSDKPAFCKVELIEVTEGLGLGPGPVFYDRNCERIQDPEISTIEIHELCHKLLYARGIHGEIHIEIESEIATWLEDKKIKVKR